MARLHRPFFDRNNDLLSSSMKKGWQRLAKAGRGGRWCRALFVDLRFEGWLEERIAAVEQFLRRSLNKPDSFYTARGRTLFRQLEIELLEARLAPTVSSSFNSGSGLLTVTSNASDPIAIEINSGFVQINGANPGTGALPVASVTSLSITGRNTIDISQLESGTLPNFQSGQIQGNGTATLIGPIFQTNTWWLTGSNQGNLDGTEQFDVNQDYSGIQGGYSFQGVPNFQGGQQEDDFVYLAPSAVITGSVGQSFGGTLSFSGAPITAQGLVIGTQPVTLEGTVITGGGSVSVNGSTALGADSSVTLQGNIYTEGGNLSVYGDTITVSNQSGNVILSTRELEDTPGNPASDPSEGNSGTISFSGTNITLGSSSSSMGSADLYSQVQSGSVYYAGAINITALQEAGAGTGTGFNFPVLPEVDTSSTSITLNNAIVVGGSVSFTANAENLHATTSAPNSSTPSIIQTGINFLQNLQLLGGVEVSNASTTIDLSSSSTIMASSFTAMAEGLTDAESAPIAISGVDVAVVVVNNNASLTAAGNITTTGDITLDTMAKNTMLIKALENSNTGNGSGGAGIAAAVAVENSTSSAIVSSAAQLTAGGNLTVQANTQNYKALQVVTTTGEDGNIGVGFAISYTDDTTTAQLNGQATVQGNALVQATEAKYGVGTSQFIIIPTLLTGVAVNAGVGTNDTGNLINNAQGVLMTKYISPILTNIKKAIGLYHAPSAAQVPSIQAAAAVALDFETNTATASVGSSAVVDVVGDLTVDANTNDRPNVLASSGVNQPSPATSSSASPTEFAASVAVAIGQYTNNATAFIDSGASVNSGGKLSVTTETLNDFELSYGVNIAQAIEQHPNDTTTQQGAFDVTLNPNDIVEDEDNNSSGSSGDWYQYVGAGTEPDVDLVTTNFANPLMWTDLGAGWSYKIVHVIQTFTTYLDNSFGVDNNLADTWSQATGQPADNQQPANIAASGCITWLTVDQNSNASINSSAQINQSTDPTYRTGNQSVFVLATDSNSSLNLGGTVQVPGLTGDNSKLKDENNKLTFGANGLPQPGTQSGQDSIGVAAVVVQYTDDVTATIASGVNLYADSLDVDAETAVGNFSAVVSGVSSSGSSAWNGVVTVVLVNDRTLAQIAAGSNIVVGNQNVVETFPNLANEPTFTPSALADALPGAMGTDASGDPTDTVSASTIVQAHDNLDLINFAGGITTGGNLGFGATVAYDEVQRDTEAYIGDPSTSAGNGSVATLTSGGNVIVDAKNNGNVDPISLAAADPGNSTSGGGSSGGVGISGDVSINQVDSDTTLAYVHNAKVIAPALIVNAANPTEIIAVTGSAAVLTGPNSSSAGIAGSYAQNDLNNVTTNAFVNNATLTLTADLDLDATAQSQIYSVAISGTLVLGNQGLSIAGQISINTINGGSTDADVSNTSLATPFDLVATANNNDYVFALSGALALGGNTGVGAALATNSISNTADADVDSSTIGSELNPVGGVILTAGDSGEIQSITVGGTYANSFAAGGAVSLNSINNNTDAFIDGNSQVYASGNMSLTANDNLTIEALAGGLAITAGNAAIGASFSTNDIGNTTEAYIDGSLVNANTLTMSSTSGETIESLTAARGRLVVVRTGGAVGLSSITDYTEVYITDGATVDLTGDLTMTAKDDPEVSKPEPAPWTCRAPRPSRLESPPMISTTRRPRTSTAGQRFKLPR